MKNRLAKWLVAAALLAALLVVVSAVSLCVGSARIPVHKVPSILLSDGTSAEHTIIRNIRLPRILLGLAVGGALSLAGVVLQGMFRNPLVEPYTLGISGGAALGVCLNIVLQMGARYGVLTLPVCGFAGALAIIGAVYYLGTRKGIMNIRELLLTGVMISFVCSSLMMLVLATSRMEEMHGIIFWIMGSLEEPNVTLVKAAVIISLGGLLLSYYFCMDLNAFALGEEEAHHLGVHVERTKRLLFLLASLLTGLAVSVAGVIGFVGLVVPHMMRTMVGSDHRALLVTSFLGGGAFLVLCDTVARTIIAPIELPVGVITGILGGAIFIYVLSRRNIVLGEK